MPDRRTGTDRRQQPRDTPERRHGDRRTYQRLACRCTPCKAAEATYRARLRARHAHEQPILGSHRDARSTWRQIRALRIEGFSLAEIARRLGLRRPRLRLHPERITLRTALRVHRLYRTVFAEPESLISTEYGTRGQTDGRGTPEGVERPADHLEGGGA